jgi:hypothetical protein
MKSRLASLLAICLLILGVTAVSSAQKSDGPSELSVAQRLEVLTSKLEAMRRSLGSAISSMAPAPRATTRQNQTWTIRSCVSKDLRKK